MWNWWSNFTSFGLIYLNEICHFIKEKLHIKYFINLKNNIKIGFPLNSINLVLRKLESLRINYIVINNKNIINQKEYEDNNFSKFTSSVFEIISINSRIEKIIEKLKSIDNNSINDILGKIENVVNI